MLHIKILPYKLEGTFVFISFNPSCSSPMGGYFYVLKKIIISHEICKGNSVNWNLTNHMCALRYLSVQILLSITGDRYAATSSITSGEMLHKGSFSLGILIN